MIEPLITDIEALDINTIPPWASVLMNSIKGVLKFLSEFKPLTEKLEELESYSEVCKSTSQLLRSDLDKAQEKIKELELKIDDQEQRSRNQCLLFHGIPEDDNEDTDVQIIEMCSEHLNMDLNISAIERSHRLGPRRQSKKPSTRNNRKDDKPRPIIARFSSYRDRQSLFSIKKKLKGKNISITENLTKSRLDLLKKANDKYGKGKCWSQEGRIFTKIGNNFKVISSEDDL